MSSDSEMAAFIGLDWADQQHALCLRAAGSGSIEPSVLDQKPESLQAWIQQLRLRFGGRPVAIILEQSRGALLYALMDVDFLRLYPVNPQTLAKFRKALYPSGAKDDPTDAALLLELLEKHREHLHVWVPDDPDTRCLRLLNEARRKLVDQKTGLTNEVTSLLKGYFPQALSWAGDLDTRRACAFLDKWPSLEGLRRSSRATLEKFYRQHGCPSNYTTDSLLEEIQQAQPLTRDPAVSRASALMVQALMRQVRGLLESIAQFNRQIKDLFEKHPDYEVFDSFPGAGPALGPRLLALFGSDRNRFLRAEEVQLLSGIAPVTERSGKSQRVHWRWACSKFLRQSVQEFSAQSIRRSLWAQACYDRLRAVEKSHHAALRAVGYKWIRIMFRCWKDHTPYDEQRYLAALRRRSSPFGNVLPFPPKRSLVNKMSFSCAKNN
jgi:transposase